MMEHLPARIFKMISVLHSRGYESIYLYSGMSPSGLNWRFSIGVAKNGEWPSNKIITEGSIKSIGEIEWSQNDYLPEKLADDFEDYYKDKLSEAKVKNIKYIAWYGTLSEVVKSNAVLTFYADYPAPHEEHLMSAPGYKYNN
jgi:hypothetical protein